MPDDRLTRVAGLFMRAESKFVTKVQVQWRRHRDARATGTRDTKVALFAATRAAGVVQRHWVDHAVRSLNGVLQHEKTWLFRTGWQRRATCVRDDTLCWYASTSMSGRPQAELPLLSVTDVHVRSAKTAEFVVQADKPHLLRAGDCDEMMRWVTVLRRAVRRAAQHQFKVKGWCSSPLRASRRAMAGTEEQLASEIAREARTSSRRSESRSTHARSSSWHD